MFKFNLKNFYLFLFFLGTGLHAYFGLSWYLANGFCLRRALFAVASTSAGMAVLIDSLTCLVATLFFIIWEGSRKRIAYYWVPAILTVLVGGCAGLPLFLFIREANNQ